MRCCVGVGFERSGCVAAREEPGSIRGTIAGRDVRMRIDRRARHLRDQLADAATQPDWEHGMQTLGFVGDTKVGRSPGLWAERLPQSIEQ